MPYSRWAWPHPPLTRKAVHHAVGTADHRFADGTRRPEYVANQCRAYVVCIYENRYRFLDYNAFTPPRKI